MGTPNKAMQESEAFLNVNNREFEELKRKFERLKESHRKLLSVNQNLEEKLLKNINCYENEKCSLMHTIKSLDFKLYEVQQMNQRLMAENVN